MKIEELYNNIKNNKVGNELIIFLNQKNNDFIANQYINEIAQQHNLQKEIIEDLSEIKFTTNIFDSFIEPTLKVYKCEKFDSADSRLLSTTNLIINCESIPKAVKEIFSSYIVEVPKLEDWQVKDLIYSQLPGMSDQNLNSLFNLCKDNIYRTQTEIDKLQLFEPTERDLIYQQFVHDSVYDDLTSKTIFEFINAITKRDFETISKVYLDLYKLDSNPIGISVLLYNNFKSIIKIQTTKCPTAANCHMSSGQFYAMTSNNLTNYYSKVQLANAFLVITDIDRKLKLGELEVDKILDYLLVNIFAN